MALNIKDHNRSKYFVILKIWVIWYNTHDSQRLKGGLFMKTKSLVNAAMMMAVYLVFFILYNIGILPSIMTFLLPIPLVIYSVVSQKISDILLLLVGCLVGTYLIGSVYGLMTTLLYGVMGTLLGIGMVKGWPYWNRILNASIVFVVVMPLTTYILTKLSMSEMFLDIMNEMFGMVSQVEGLMPEDSISQLMMMQEMMQTFIPMLMPTLLLIMGGVEAFISDKIATQVLKRMKVQIPEIQPISEFQLGSKLAILLIISQLMMMFITHQGLTVIFLNVAMLLNTLFMIQGAIVAIQFFHSRNQKGLGVMLVVLAILSNLVTFISIIGMMDALFDYRKRFLIKGV